VFAERALDLTGDRSFRILLSYVRNSPTTQVNGRSGARKRVLRVLQLSHSLFQSHCAKYRN